MHHSVGDQPLYLLTGCILVRGLVGTLMDNDLSVEHLARVGCIAVQVAQGTHDANARVHAQSVG